MDAIEKAAMEAFLAAATRDQSTQNCIAEAVEAYRAVSAERDPARARRIVTETLVRLRLLPSASMNEDDASEEAEAIVAAYRYAVAAGLHPESGRAHAVDLWLRRHPDSDHATAEQRVARILADPAPSRSSAGEEPSKG
ncbi:MAG TPA: hypothetical protein VGD08_19345 [Stellaceae bacterium]|jgi:hypothetical protein